MIHLLKLIGTITLGICILCVFAVITPDVLAQPAMPTPPPRPIPWSGIPFIAAGCAGYLWWKMNRER
jgi:hypothetical protein